MLNFNILDMLLKISDTGFMHVFTLLLTPTNQSSWNLFAKQSMNYALSYKIFCIIFTIKNKSLLADLSKLSREALKLTAFTFSKPTIKVLTKIKCGICLKLTIKTPEWRRSRCSGDFVNYKHVNDGWDNWLQIFTVYRNNTWTLQKLI